MILNLLVTIMNTLLTALNIYLYLDNTARWWNLSAAIVCGICTIVTFVLMIKSINRGY